MASHTEPILKPFQLREPSRAFNNLFIAYAKALNKATGRTGVLFQTPFRRKSILTESYFANVVVYIHRNAQHHRFVEDFRDWPWSSYGACESQKATHIQRDEVLTWFDGIEQFRESHRHDANPRVIKPLIDDDFD